ncbi:hypothetical protein [Streptomyces sp. 3N207]|uniref:hypothetical protein n=1 Tax=Streptomyces sp. 3N207 TaxID=3457417 RepID=UPI003FD4E438
MASPEPGVIPEWWRGKPEWLRKLVSWVVLWSIPAAFLIGAVAAVLTGIHVEDSAILPPEACGSVISPEDAGRDDLVCEPARSARLGWAVMLLVGGIATAVPATITQVRRGAESDESW